MQETRERQLQSLGREDPLEEKMATHSRLGNPADRAWWATVHGVTASDVSEHPARARTHTYTHTHTHTHGGVLYMLAFSLSETASSPLLCSFQILNTPSLSPTVAEYLNYSDNGCN